MLSAAEIISPDVPQWFVMRDLKRANALHPAYRQLAEEGFEVYTPMQWVVRTGTNGRRRRERVPFVRDLLFVRSTRSLLDPVVRATATLQYRFMRGAAFGTALTVRDTDMARFMGATAADESARFYSPDELTAQMYGRRIRIVGGPLDGYQGRLLSVKGMRKRRLIVELPGLLTAAVEVDPDFISFVQ